MLTACTIAAFCTCIHVQTNLKTEFFFAMKLDFQTREHCVLRLPKSVAFSLLVANLEVI